MAHLDPLIAAGVVVSTAVTDAVYVMFNAAASDRRRFSAALGSWLGGFLSITVLNRLSGASR